MQSALRRPALDLSSDTSPLHRHSRSSGSVSILSAFVAHIRTYLTLHWCGPRNSAHYSHRTKPLCDDDDELLTFEPLGSWMDGRISCWHSAPSSLLVRAGDVKTTFSQDQNEDKDFIFFRPRGASDPWSRGLHHWFVLYGVYSMDVKKTFYVFYFCHVLLRFSIIFSINHLFDSGTRPIKHTRNTQRQ